MINGVININKEKGYTSHDIVAIVRNMLGRIKTGHTGTLDPNAEGVLPVCVGKATKIADYIMAETKGYRAVVNLGVVTDTEDETGVVIATQEVCLDLDTIQNTIASFVGEYYQTPPMYSAIKVKGKKLYELAREGQVIERKQRLIRIDKIEVVEFLAHDKVLIDVVCSKGTYIRTLCKDIGDRLGCGASMGSLLRTFSGSFTLENSVTINELKKIVEMNEIEKVLIPIEDVLSRYRRVKALQSATVFLQNGNSFDAAYLQEPVEQGDEVLVFDDSGVLMGIYQVIIERNTLRMKPVSMLCLR